MRFDEQLLLLVFAGGQGFCEVLRESVSSTCIMCTHACHGCMRGIATMQAGRQERIAETLQACLWC